ncbi:cysteine dioxygenase [Undibacterium sp. TJN25]|uniref:cysteine dioxygenase family protein n=1 Tax=Undibacterium sp. TJN25 TaxID=3413056 RepID=UPI003BF22E86
MPNHELPAGLSAASGRLQNFVSAFSALLDGQPPEPVILDRGAALLRALVSADDWLPEACARPDATHYQQFLLHADTAKRFSVVSFVWGPGQQTPIHNHTVWGLIGMLRGAEVAQRFSATDSGALAPDGEAARLEPGTVDAVSPSIGDVHQVSNAYADKVSISIHVYGADIGEVRRSVFYPDGSSKDFISGYSTPAFS